MGGASQLVYGGAQWAHRGEGVCPRNGLCDSCACGCVAGVVHLLGSAGRVGFVVVLLSLASGSPLVGVFVGVRFGGRGIPGNVLLSQIYVSACSEPPLAKEFFKKDAQSFPETRISNLVRGRDFCS